MDSPIEFEYIIILNVIILVKDNIICIVLINASLYLNWIKKPNVLYINQSLTQIENRLKFTDWDENNKRKKENLRFRLFKKKKKNLSRILANIQDEMRGIFQETLAVEMAKGTNYSFSCHDHNATNMIS